MSKSRLLPTLLASLALFAAGCSSNPTTSGSESAASGSESTGTETTAAAEMADEPLNGYACEPQSLIPSNATESCGSDILSALFTPLVRIDKEGKAVYGDKDPDTVLADVTISEDKKVYTLKLKDTFTFHNGDKVDAESYVRAWNFGANPKNAQSAAPFYDKIAGYKDVEEGKATELSGLKAVDATTLEVTLTEPFIPFISSLAYTAFYPLPQVAVDDIDAFNEAPIGNGPFKLDGKWEHNQSFHTVAHDTYPGTKQSFPGVNFTIFADINTAYNELRSGSIDVMYSLPQEQQSSFETDLGDRVYEKTTNTIHWLGVPQYQAKFKDKRIAQALSMAIDRETIIKSIFNSNRKAADDFVSPAVEGYREGACEYCKFDPAKAKELYDAAGGIEDGTVEVWFNSGSGHEEWVEAVANGWKQHLGIKEVKFETMIFAEYLNKLEEKKDITGPYRLGWSADYPAMDNYLFPVLGTKGSSNYSGYANEKFDELVAKGNAAATTEEAIKFYQEADDLAIEDMPLIPTFFGKAYSGTSERVEGFELDFYDHPNYHTLKPAAGK